MDVTEGPREGRWECVCVASAAGAARRELRNADGTARYATVHRCR